MREIFIMDYFSAIRRIKVLIHVISWMNLENMLNEISQLQKDILYVLFYLYIPRIGKFIESESRLEIT